jgi:hypothetical protein
MHGIAAALSRRRGVRSVGSPPRMTRQASLLSRCLRIVRVLANQHDVQPASARDGANDAPRHAGGRHAGKRKTCEFIDFDVDYV